MKALVITLAIFCIQVNAAPPPEVVERIQKNYDPTIQTAVEPAGFAENGCAFATIKIVGKDPITHTDRNVIAREYLALGKSDRTKMRTVIVMPPTGGENELDRVYAKTLCARGFRVALLQSWDLDTFTELDMGMHDRGAERALAAVRHLIEHLTVDQPDVKIGILGTSVGAITSALVTGYDSRIRTAVFIVGGTGMSEIISQSIEQGLTRLRKERFEAYRFTTNDEYRAALAKHISIEPQDFVNFSGPKNILSVIGTADKTVPTKNQWDLHKAFGKQELLTYDGNHIETIIHSRLWFKSKIVNFLDSNL